MYLLIKLDRQRPFYVGLKVITVLVAGFLLASQCVYGQTTYYSRVNNGNWNTASTWSTDPVLKCTGAAAAAVPGAADNVVICNGFTVVYNTASTTIANLTVEIVGVLTISNNTNISLNSLVLDGTVNGNGSGDLRMATTAGATLSGTGFFSNTNTGCQLRANGNNFTILAGTDLKFDGGAVFNLNGRTITNNGKISILNPSNFGTNGTFVNAATGYMIYSRLGNWPGMTLNATAIGNTVEYGAASGTRRMDTQSSYCNLIISGGGIKQIRANTTTIRGNLTIGNGVSLETATANRTINIAGNWINNLGGSFTETNFATVTFNATNAVGLAAQSIFPPAGGETFNNLVINNTATNGSVTSSGAVLIANGSTLTMTSGIFDMGANTLNQASGTANLTATGGDLRLGKLATTLPEFTGTYNITGGTITFNGSPNQTIRSLTGAPAGSNYWNVVLSGGGSTKTLAGNIAVRGNWTNTGSTLAGAVTVSFTGTGVQTITNTSGEVFPSVTINGTGPITLAATTDITINTTLTMTAGNINLNGRTLTLGNGSGASLVRTAGIAYGGTFKRYLPAGAISSSSAPLYGLFPVGTSLSYRPVAVDATANPATAGTLSVTHNNLTSVTDVSYNDNEGAAITRITDMNDAIVSTMVNGTYTLGATFGNLSAAGTLSDLKMETVAGPPYGVGLTVATSGTLTAPVVTRSGLTASQLTNTFVVGTKDRINTPLVAAYYSRKTGSWNDATVGNSTWSLVDGGPSCNCIPIASSVVFINAHTVSITGAAASADYITVRTGGTLDGTSNLTANFDITTVGVGKIAPTGGSWSIGSDLFIQGTSVSTSSIPISIAGNLSIDAGNSLSTTNTLSVAGNLTVDGTLSIGASTMTLSGSNSTISGSAGIINGSGTISINNGKTITALTSLTVQPTINLLAGTTVTNLGTLTTTGNITGTNAATSVWVNGASSVLNTTAAVLTTGALDASAASNTVNYNGAGAQTVKAPSTSYFDLIISNAGTKTAGGNITVSDLLTVQDAAIFIMGTNSLNGIGGLSMTIGNPELRIATAAAGTYPELTGTYTLTAGAITMNQTSSASYDMAAIDFYNLNLSGSGNTGNGSSYDFLSGASVVNNLTVNLSGTSRFRNTNAPLVVGNDFVFNSTSTNTSTMSSNLTVGTFTLTSGLFNASGSVLEISLSGGWTQNGGTFTPSTSTILFSGTVDQSVNGSVSPTFTNVEISNSGPTGVTLNNSISVTGVFTFTDGELITLGANLLKMLAGSSVASVSNSSFVTGPMTKAGNTAFTFPVGKDHVYRPIQITGVSAVGTFQAEYFHANPTSAGYNIALKDATINHIGAGEYWLLNITAGTPNAFVTLSWDTYSGIVDDLPNLKVARWNGATWKDLGNGGTTGSASPGTGTVITSAIVGSASFGPFTIGSGNSNNPLPIGLTAFSAHVVSGTVSLNWTTETERNNDFFTIERTSDTEQFEEVAQVKGGGTTTWSRSYTNWDYRPLPGRSYYRLKQTDFDGTISYSRLVAVFVPVSSTWSVYPNPSNGLEFGINFTAEDIGKIAYVQVQDIEGKELFKVATENLNTTQVRIETPQKLIPGFYIVSIAVEQQVMRQKLIVR